MITYDSATMCLSVKYSVSQEMTVSIFGGNKQKIQPLASFNAKYGGRNHGH
jgi:hypothetical protein